MSVVPISRFPSVLIGGSQGPVGGRVTNELVSSALSKKTANGHNLATVALDFMSLPGVVNARLSLEVPTSNLELDVPGRLRAQCGGCCIRWCSCSWRPAGEMEMEMARERGSDGERARGREIERDGRAWNTAASRGPEEVRRRACRLVTSYRRRVRAI